jgi:uncharacterized membrane protein
MFRSGCGLVLLVAVALGCSSDPAPPVNPTCDGLTAGQRATLARPACPNDLPSDADCTGTTPSYQADVASVISERCQICHGPGGVEAVLPLSTHAQLFGQRRTVLNQIFTCLMPPACAADLTGDERATVMKWLVCGALDN